MTAAAKRMARAASVILIVLGVGHLTLLLAFNATQVAGWAERGVWAAVPLLIGADGDATEGSLRNALAFWAGPGSFALPSILLGCLVWWLGERGITAPAWLGWGIAVWTAIGGIILVPSPFFVGTAAGLLIVAAARRAGSAAVRDPAAPDGERAA